MRRTRRRRQKEYRVQLTQEQLDQLQLDLVERLSPKPKAGPEFSEFAGRFLEWAQTERQKHSSLEAKRSALRLYLHPLFDGTRLSELRDEHVLALKKALVGRSPKRVNNVLSVLRRMLKLAVHWRELDAVPVVIDGLKVHPAPFEFYDFEQYETLLDGARRAGPRELVLVLLGGDAGLRMGEMLAIEWDDVDLHRRQLAVLRAEWQGVVSSPKGGRTRAVPLTEHLVEGLRLLERTAARVLGSLSVQQLRDLYRRTQLRAGVPVTGRLHVLRHTFCSHLAMRGAPAIAIKELAGHKDLATTDKYMHLARSEAARAIGLLDAARVKTPGPGTREPL